ncbi:MAG: 4-hydroxy-tetrahydrodipicolinate synthase [Bdellovibrionales bacterium]|nr:4-hydroxy-tetrahydrodipicolinate synthase [Bdellovibrionales bacterium]
MYKPQGIITALITPFKNQKVDFNSLKKLIDSQIAGGVQGFVVNGTTAESPTLEPNEVEEIYLFVKKHVPKNFPIILGTGSNSTKKTIEASLRAKKWGADAALVVVPYYNKPTQEGLLQHFTAVANEADVPLILYNVPSRTVTSMSAKTCAALSKHKAIVGIKEASGDMSLAKDIVDTVEANFSLLSGDDGTFLQQSLLGGVGCISVLSHVIPKETVEALNSAVKKDSSVVEKFKKYEMLTNLLFKEPNPAPVKYILKKMGIIESDELRLPLVTCTASLAGEIDKELERLEII